MDTIRPETETDRSERALAELGLALPLRSSVVEIEASDEALESPAGQKLVVLLVNVLARMKGVVSAIHLPGVGGQKVDVAVPVLGESLADGIDWLALLLSTHGSEHKARIEFGSHEAPTVRVAVGPQRDGAVIVGADAWRALLGRYAGESDWQTTSPFGPAMAAVIAAAEVFKRLVAANGGTDSGRVSLHDLRFSLFNYGVDDAAESGPANFNLTLRDVAVLGCGAGGTAALYVLAMLPMLAGGIALVEPSVHKPSNLNRYLMASACDVTEPRHKLASVAEHLARFAPRLAPTLYPLPWEQLTAPPWTTLISTVDTVETRWQIQRRAVAGAEILDAAVLDLLYTVLRVVPGGWCLECKHPFDPLLPLKQRSARWGVPLETAQQWEVDDVVVTAEMIERLAQVQGIRAEMYAILDGKRWNEVTEIIECGETRLRADVPSQAPVLPLATTAAGVVLAAEVAKREIAPERQLQNWLAHDLGRTPKPGMLSRFRQRREDCPRH